MNECEDADLVRLFSVPGCVLSEHTWKVSTIIVWYQQSWAYWRWRSFGRNFCLHPVHSTGEEQ